MFYFIVAAIVAVLLLVMVVLNSRGGGGRRGNLLGPPPGLGRKAGSTPHQPPPRPGRATSPFANLPDQVAVEARGLVAQNRKIEAVKLVREATRCSLTEAKEWVEAL